MFRAALFIALMTLHAVAQTDAAAAERLQKQFDSGMKSVSTMMSNGKWKEAQTALKKLLDQHIGADHAIARRDEIAESLKRCAFRVAFPAPEAKALVKGDLLSWDPSSGRIKIRYKNANDSDFETESASRVFPAAFTGSHTIEMKGDGYPTVGVGPVFLVCMSPKKAWQVYPGYPPFADAKSYVPSRIVEVGEKEDDEGKSVDTEETSPCKPDKPYSLKIEVGATSISLSYNGSPFLRASKPATAWGYFGYRGFIPKEITIDGKIEPSWIQNMIDEAVQKYAALFEKSWNPSIEIPGWLFAEPKKTAQESIGAEVPDYPGSPSEKEIKQIDDLVLRAMRDRVGEARERLASLSDFEITPSSRQYVLAICAIESGDYAGAEKHITEIEKIDAGWAGSHLLRGRMLMEQGKPAEAAAAIEKALAKAPGDAECWILLTTILMQQNRADDARKSVQRARQSGAAAGEYEKFFDRLASSIEKMTRGPDWTRTFDYKSTNYHVFSDIDKETCSTASRLLEDALLIYSVRLREVKKGGPQFRVYLFSGLAGYEKYCETVIGGRAENTAGLYSPVIKQLLIWNLPERAEMMRTVLHEGFHQYLDRICPGEIPTWFNEGSAVYFENAKLVGGNWTTGQIDRTYSAKAADILRGQTGFTLSEFLRLPPERFYGDAERNYALAWSFVHFLRHSKSEYAKTYEAFFNALADGIPAKKALADHFPAERLDALTSAYTTHVAGFATLKDK